MLKNIRVPLMPHIQLKDATYYYERHGQGDPLVLIAGYSCDHVFWDAVVQELVAHYDIVSFDNRGIGQTKDSGSSLSLELMANETIELIQALNIKSPIIVGHSMGGIIAQIIAKQSPNLAKKIVILNSAPSISPRSIMTLEMFIKLINDKAPINTIIEASMPWFFSSQFLENKKNIKLYIDHVMSNPFPQTFDDLARQFQALKEFNPAKWSKSITVPVFVISSNDDIICTPIESKEILKTAPQAKFVTINGGHSTPVEVPKEVAQAILSLLA